MVDLKRQLSLAGVPPNSASKLLVIMGFREKLALSLFESEILLNAGITSNDALGRYSPRALASLLRERYPAEIVPSTKRISAWVTSARGLAGEPAGRRRRVGRRTPERFETVDYDFQISADSVLFRQFFSRGMTMLGGLFFGSPRRFRCWEVGPGVVCFPHGELDRFFKEYADRVREDPHYVASVVGQLRRSIRRAKGLTIRLEGQIETNTVRVEALVDLFDAISSTTALRYSSVAFPYAAVRDYLSSAGLEAEKTIQDVQFAETSPVYIKYHSAILRLVKGFIADGRVDLGALAHFRRNYAFLGSFSVEPSKWYADDLDLSAESSSHGSLQDIGRGMKSLSASRRAARKRMVDATDDVMTGCFARNEVPPVLLFNLSMLMREFTTHEEARTYWELRSLQSFRRVLSLSGLDIHASSIEDIVKKMKEPRANDVSEGPG